MTKIRDDKLPKDATTLAELENLFKTSKEQVLVLDEEVGDHDEVDDSGDDPKADKSSDLNVDPEPHNGETTSPVLGRSSKRKVTPADLFSDCDTEQSEGSSQKTVRQRKKFKTEELPIEYKGRECQLEPDSTNTQPLPKAPRIPPCNLPNVFNGIVIQSLPGDRNKYENLRRYFIAYGGTFSDKGVTHRIGTTKDTTKVEWLIESVKRRRLVDEDPFKN